MTALSAIVLGGTLVANFDASVQFGRELLVHEDVDAVSPPRVADELSSSVDVSGREQGAEGEATTLSLRLSVMTSITTLALAMLNTVHAIVVAIDSGFEAFHGSDLFIQFQQVVLAALCVATMLDAMLDLRRFSPTVRRKAPAF